MRRHLVLLCFLSTVGMAISALWTGRAAAEPLPPAAVTLAAGTVTVPQPASRADAVRVAQANAMDAWQQRAFSSIEEQKRLDALLRANRRSAVPQRTAAPKVEGRKVALRRRPTAVRLRPTVVRRTSAGAVTKAPRDNTPEPFKTVFDAASLQRCLQAVGVYEGEISGRMDKPTFVAFGRFRAERKLTARPENPYDPVLQQQLFAACGHPDGQFPSDATQQAAAHSGPPEPAANVGEPIAGTAPAAPSGSVRTLAAFAPAGAPTSSRVRIADLFSSRPAVSDTCAPQPGGLLSPEEGSEPAVTGALDDFGTQRPRPASQSVERLAPIEDAGGCLPRDLYDALSAAYGPKPGIAVCKSECLPAPEAFSEGEKSLFGKQYTISWCGPDCLGIAAPMPLDDVLRIERESNMPVCVKPQQRLQPVAAATLDRDGATPAVRALFDRLPGGYGNGDNLAVIIGNRGYGTDIGVNPSARLDAAAMRAVLLGQLGYRAQNVIVLEDAKRDDLLRVFGGKTGADSELARRLKANPNAQLTIYYAGHAASKRLGLENYLLPVDAVAGKEAETGYALDLLYDNLRKLDARSTLLFLEAGFGDRRDGSVLPPNVAERRVTVAPVTPVRGLAVFTAAEGDQLPLVDVETGLGLFTRHLLTGLAGKADAAPFGNGDSILDSVELHVHIARNVGLAARKTLGLMQTPTLSRAETLFLSQLSRK